MFVVVVVVVVVGGGRRRTLIAYGRGCYIYNAEAISMSTMANVSSSKSTQAVCVGCGGPWHQAYRFCPACGTPAAGVVAAHTPTPRTPLSYRGLFAIGATAVVLLASGSAVQAVVHWNRQDKRPTQPFVASEQGKAGSPHTAQVESAEPVADATLDKLRADLKTDPNNVAKLKAVAMRIGELLRDRPSTPSALALEAIDALSSVVKQTPEDAEALILMADVSFDQRAFDKAREFYERYLKLAPEDLGARARYASTLTFLKKFDESIAELQKVMSVDPNNFPAKAYLAITYAEKGDLRKAKELAQAALAAAPNEEAKARFSKFVQSLEASEKEGAPDQTSALSASPALNDAANNDVTKHIANHPIAGSKFVRAELTASGDLKIYMKEFPMAAMPPVVREKFSAGIKVKMPSSMAKVILVDEPSGEVMAEVAR